MSESNEKEKENSNSERAKTGIELELQVIGGCRRWLDRLPSRESRVRVMRYVQDAINEYGDQESEPGGETQDAFA